MITSNILFGLGWTIIGVLYWLFRDDYIAMLICFALTQLFFIRAEINKK